MNIPNKAVEATAEALFNAENPQGDWHRLSRGSIVQDIFRARALWVLEAAAPHIAAQALRDASNAYPLETAYGGAEHAVNWLRQRAEQFEAPVKAGAFLLEDG